MRYRYLARELFLRTRSLPIFSVNELRFWNLHEKFKHPNDSGEFFLNLVKEGWAVKEIKIRAIHPGARGRKVWAYKWTGKAVVLFGGS